MVALFESLWVSYWQGGGMFLTGGSTATVSGTSYTSCSARDASGCTWGPLQPDNVAYAKVWAVAHTTISEIFMSEILEISMQIFIAYLEFLGHKLSNAPT